MKRWQIFLGLVLILLGLFSIVNTLFEINVWRFVGPLVLIGLGVLLILRPQMVGPGVEVKEPVLGDIKRAGAWEVTDQEIWWFVGGNRLDFTDAIFIEDQITIKIIGFVTEVRITLPEDVGLKINAVGFYTEFKGFDYKEERFVSMVDYLSPNYHEMKKQVQLETVAFVSDIKVKPSLI